MDNHNTTPTKTLYCIVRISHRFAHQLINPYVRRKRCFPQQPTQPNVYLMCQIWEGWGLRCSGYR